MDKKIQILCDQDDPRIDDIAERMSILNKAIEDGYLVAISCKYEATGTAKVLLAVVSSNDDADEYVKYSPIGELFYPEDESYMNLAPPASALPVEDSDVKH